MRLSLDVNDLRFYIGLIALFAGLWLSQGLGLALTVAGAIISAVSLINSFVMVWVSKSVVSKNAA